MFEGLPLNAAAMAAACPFVLLAALALRRRGQSGSRSPTARVVSRPDGVAHAVRHEDPLTGLPDRIVFEQWLAAAVARADRVGGRLAVLFINLHGFRLINDSYGHGCGDGVLREVAARLRRLARDGDPVARVGGDEFLLLIEGRSCEEVAKACAARVIAILSQMCRVDSRNLTLSCSVGIALHPDAGPPARLIAHAAAAMAAAKRGGGSCACVFDASMESNACDQLDMQRDLRRAVERGELELCYQPKVDVRTGRVTAAEALLRWRHPNRGMVGPDVFIPLAERFGIVGLLGDWVIEAACRQLRAWCDEGLHMRLAINLSALQLRQRDLHESIATALRRHRIDPRLLTCEITETAAMEDVSATLATFRSLGELGVHLSIDDFGTGYSSLAYLRKLPVSELKIDRSFVADLDSSVDARAVVRAVIGLAHALRLKVVAEGVETETQRGLLADMGCNEMQGYLFARPMSAAALLLWASDDDERKVAFQPSLFQQLQCSMA